MISVIKFACFLEDQWSYKIFPQSPTSLYGPNWDGVRGKGSWSPGELPRKRPVADTCEGNWNY